MHSKECELSVASTRTESIHMIVLVRDRGAAIRPKHDRDHGLSVLLTRDCSQSITFDLSSVRKCNTSSPATAASDCLDPYATHPKRVDQLALIAPPSGARRQRPIHRLSRARLQLATLILPDLLCGPATLLLRGRHATGLQRHGLWDAGAGAPTACAPVPRAGGQHTAPLRSRYCSASLKIAGAVFFPGHDFF